MPAASPLLDALYRVWSYLLPSPEISRARAMAPELELYAEAGAPEGAQARAADYLPGSTGLYIGR